MEIRPLNREEQLALQEGLELAATLLDEKLPLDASQVQELYDVLLRDRPNGNLFAIALGLAFGELVAGKTQCEWARVSSPFGEETALNVDGTGVVCYPISVMQKRLELRAKIDLAQLADQIARIIGEDAREFRRS